ncbi:hypothetical protein ElyMa_003516200 [Elysia marginata]|uniref:Uncharacterized protein n=1 Tax=Elysia marginata TaxID=1093978 RepID=A0AAV4EFL1_9GAST|nr:hypothetical protein ElyMa_003516200 [Elysia marginata]
MTLISWHQPEVKSPTNAAAAAVSAGMLQVEPAGQELRRRSRTSLASIIEDLSHLRKSLLRQKSEGEVGQTVNVRVGS